MRAGLFSPGHARHCPCSVARHASSGWQCGTCVLSHFEACAPGSASRQPELWQCRAEGSPKAERKALTGEQRQSMAQRIPLALSSSPLCPSAPCVSRLVSARPRPAHRKRTRACTELGPPLPRFQPQSRRRSAAARRSLPQVWLPPSSQGDPPIPLPSTPGTIFSFFAPACSPSPITHTPTHYSLLPHLNPVSLSFLSHHEASHTSITVCTIATHNPDISTESARAEPLPARRIEAFQPALR